MLFCYGRGLIYNGLTMSDDVKYGEINGDVITGI